MSERSFPWRTVVFASLAVNLLLIGAVIGGYASGLRLERAAGPHDRMDMRQPPRGGFLGALPDKERALVREDLRRSFLATRDLRAAARVAREDVMNLATGDTYDVEAVRAALGRMREADLAVAQAFHDAVAETLADLTPDQRRDALEAFVRDRLGMGGGRFRDRRRGRDGEGEGEPPPPPPLD